MPFPSPGDLPDPGIKAGSPTLQAASLPSEPPGKPLKNMWLNSINAFRFLSPLMYHSTSVEPSSFFGFVFLSNKIQDYFFKYRKQGINSEVLDFITGDV